MADFMVGLFCGISLLTALAACGNAMRAANRAALCRDLLLRTIAHISAADERSVKAKTTEALREAREFIQDHPEVLN